MKIATLLTAMAISAFIFVVTSVSFFGGTDSTPLGDNVDAIMDNAFYCSMVQQWEKEAAKGIKPDDRTGWPPFRGPCK